jgi:hypothetical protein
MGAGGYLCFHNLAAFFDIPIFFCTPLCESAQPFLSFSVAYLARVLKRRLADMSGINVAN